jgi:membrane protein
MNSLREKLQGFMQHLMRIPAVQLLVRSFQELSDDDGTHMAAGVAYYAMLSIFPLLLGVLSISTLFFNEQIIRERIVGFTQENLPGTQNLITQNIRNIYQLRGIFGIVSVLGLFWTASAMFGAISRSVNRAWDISEDRPFYIAKMRQLLMAISVIVLLGLSVALGALASIVGQAGQAVAQGIPFLESTVFDVVSRLVSLLLAFIVFALIYRFVPNSPVKWRDIWLGALVAAIGFEVAKWAFVFYLNNFANYQQIYGSLASIVILLVWMYVSALILIIGAELSSEYVRMRDGLERGTPLSEARTASEAERQKVG